MLRFPMLATGRPSPPVRRAVLGLALPALLLAAFAPPTFASSHREAPAILSVPQVDGTDFYMFRSYEEGRDGFVTLIANYNPLQDPYGGPNYFSLDPDAVYDIHIDNDGDAVEDLTFRFTVKRRSPFLALDVGAPGATESVAVPLVNVGPFGPGLGLDAANEVRFVRLRLLRGPAANPTSLEEVPNPASPAGLFVMPLDNIGEKSIPDYPGYASSYMYPVQIPGCEPGRLFVGQRKEGFQVALGKVFDLVNTNPVGPPDGEPSVTDDANISSFALELPIPCLTGGNGGVIGGWTTASLRQGRILDGDPTYDAPLKLQGSLSQVSRLGNPLVNEVVIGLPDKNRFNASHPSDDAQFLRYVTHPTLPELLQALFGVEAPNAFPREDLIQVFLTGVPGLNENGSVGEMQRLNTTIPPLPAADQDRLGVLGGDLAGFPNGRRPGDDTVDIALRAVMGVLLPENVAPAGQLPYTDGAFQDASQFLDRFPYLLTPLPGNRDE